MLSLLGCCGVPQDANAVDGTDETPLPSHKVTIPNNRPTTASHRTATPSEQSRSQPYERESHPQMTPSGGAPEPLTKPTQRAPVASSKDTPSATAEKSVPAAAAAVATTGTAYEPKKQADVPMAPSDGGGPVTMVDVLPATSSEPVAVGPAEKSVPEKDEEGDIHLRDAGNREDEGGVMNAATTDPHANNLPPPPPGPAPANQPPPDIIAAEPPTQKWLLPPVRAEHKGKKCLILDLDETLVHSSFKVSSSIAAGFRPVFVLHAYSHCAPPDSTPG